MCLRPRQHSTLQCFAVTFFAVQCKEVEGWTGSARRRWGGEGAGRVWFAAALSGFTGNFLVKTDRQMGGLEGSGRRQSMLIEDLGGKQRQGQGCLSYMLRARGLTSVRCLPWPAGCGG